MTAADATERRAVPRLGAFVRSPRAAACAFAFYLVVGWVLAVFRYGSRRWFNLDDWWVLAGRDGGSVVSIFEPHNEHLIAFGVVVYRVLLNIFGLRYTPFLI